MPVLLLNKGFETIVDAEDLPALAEHDWRISMRAKHRYARSWIDGKPVYLHRFLLKPEPGKAVDHINGNGLDNRRENLRVAWHRENMRNQKKQEGVSSGWKGVVWVPNRKKWAVHIGCSGVRVALGLFDTEIDAARAYDIAAVCLFGQFAQVNLSLQNSLRKALQAKRIEELRAPKC